MILSKWHYEITNLCVDANMKSIQGYKIAVSIGKNNDFSPCIVTIYVKAFWTISETPRNL